MIINDRRTEDQKTTHAILLGGYDRFMSPHPDGGKSYAYWAVRAENEPSVTAWLKALKTEIRKLCRYEDDLPSHIKSNAHVSIYVVNDDHPACKFGVKNIKATTIA